MTNYEMIKKIAKNVSIETVKELLEKATEEIRAEEESYKKMIPVSWYTPATGHFEYPEWVEETLHEVTKKLGIAISEYGDCKARTMKITRADFARFIIYTCNDNGIMLSNVIEVLMSAPSWSSGHGMTQSRMEFAFHILVLHKDNLSAAKEELKKFIQKYDPTSLQVFANADEAYRFTLNHKSQMIMYAEREVCKVIGSETKFRAA